MLKKVLKIIVDILTILIFAVLIVTIFVKVNVMFGKKDYFNIGGYSIFTIATGSMEPTIKQNDIIIVKETKDYKVDDIITFKNEDDYITHRIVSINGTSLVTRGDANNTNDVAINNTDIVGKVIKTYSNLGIWQKILTTPSVVVMIFITLILFDFAFSYKGKKNEKVEVKQVNKENKKEKEETIKKVKENKIDDEKIDYTIRLDLNELQKQIDSKVNKEKK